MLAVIEACFQRRRTVLAVLTVILISGTQAYRIIPKESSPDVPIPFILVHLFHHGISPEDSERMLARPIEKELRAIEGVKEMTATAAEGTAAIVLEFDAGFDNEKALSDVREKVDKAKAELPEETEEPVVSEVNIALFPILVVSLSGDLPERALVKLARDLRDKIEGLAEVLEVDIGGDREEVVELIVNPAALEMYELNQQDIIQFTARNNRLVAAGALDAGAGRLAVKVPGLFETAEDILNLPVKVRGDRVIKLRDVAAVRKTFKEAQGCARLNGQPSVSLEVKKRMGENVIATVRKVRELVEAEKRSWPGGVAVNYSQDRSEEIKTMLGDLQNNVISAVLLVMLVIVTALGWRTGLLVGTAIPASFLAGILFLSWAGYTMNIVVLFGLILAVGMLVDGAIVVAEFADRRMGGGQGREKAYLAASRRMAWPIIASTATTLAAFLPLLFWPGIVGKFMRFLPVTLIATLSAALAVALVFVPALGSLTGRPESASSGTMRNLTVSEQGNLAELEGLTGWYLRRLAAALRHPFRVVAAAAGLLALVYMLYSASGLGVVFFPDIEPDTAQLFLRMRGNLSADEMDRLTAQAEERVMGVPGVENIYARSRLRAGGRHNMPEDAHGVIQLEFSDWRDRPPPRVILADVRERIAGLPGVGVVPAENKDKDILRLRVEARNRFSAARCAELLEEVKTRLLRRDDFTRIHIESGPPDGDSISSLIGRLDLIPRESDPPLPPQEKPDGFFSLLKYCRDFAERIFPRPFIKPPWEEVEAQARRQLEDFDDMEFRIRPPRNGLPARLEVSSEGRLSWEETGKRLREMADLLRNAQGLSRIEIFSGTQVRQPAELPAGIGFLECHWRRGAPDRRPWKAVYADLEPRLTGLPGIVLEERKQQKGPPTGKAVQIEISSRHPQKIEPALQRVREHLESMEGLTDISDSRPVPAVEWQVKVDRAEAGRYGADIALLGNAIQFISNGLKIGSYRPLETDDEVDIRVRYPLEERSLGGVGRLRVAGAKGLVPVSQFIRHGPAPKVGSIERSDSRRVLKLSAEAEKGVLADNKIKEIKTWLDAEADIDPDVFIQFKGQDEEKKKSQAFLTRAFLAALALMGIILVTQFNSFYQAFLILTAVVLSTVGVLLGLLITGQPFGVVMNGIGIISLAGIVVNNNIVLIDTYNIHRKNGMPAREAVLRTSAQRFRPVLLTAVTTILGLLPMVLKINMDFISREVTFGAPSTQWWSQLSTSVAFGLAFATLLTLVLTPCLLLLGEKKEAR